jgi:hypothetical protein
MGRYTKAMHEQHLNQYYSTKYQAGPLSEIWKELGRNTTPKDLRTAWRRNRLGRLIRRTNPQGFNKSYLTQDLREVTNG